MAVAVVDYVFGLVSWYLVEFRWRRRTWDRLFGAGDSAYQDCDRGWTLGFGDGAGWLVSLDNGWFDESRCLALTGSERHAGTSAPRQLHTPEYLPTREAGT